MLNIKINFYHIGLLIWSEMITRRINLATNTTPGGKIVISIKKHGQGWFCSRNWGGIFVNLHSISFSLQTFSLSYLIHPMFSPPQHLLQSTMCSTTMTSSRSIDQVARREICIIERSVKERCREVWEHDRDGRWRRSIVVGLRRREKWRFNLQTIMGGRRRSWRDGWSRRRWMVAKRVCSRVVETA